VATNTGRPVLAAVHRADNRNYYRQLAMTPEQLHYYDSWIRATRVDSSSNVGEVVIGNVLSSGAAANYWPCQQLANASYASSLVAPCAPNCPPLLRGSGGHGEQITGGAFNAETGSPPFQMTMSPDVDLRHRSIFSQVTPPAAVSRGRGIYASGLTSSPPVVDGEETRRMWFLRQNDGSGHAVNVENAATVTPRSNHSNIESTSPYGASRGTCQLQLPITPISSPPSMQSAASSTGCSSGVTSSFSSQTPPAKLVSRN